MRIWLDDVRPAPEGWTWVKSFAEARALISDIFKDEAEAWFRDRRYSTDLASLELSLDHDLAICDTCQASDIRPIWTGCGCSCHRTGYDLLCWMEDHHIWPIRRPRVHSMNPVGRRRMEQVIDRYYDGENLRPMEDT